MTNSKQIPECDGYYWVKRQPRWGLEIIHYYKGVVYICGSQERLSPYYNVYSWGSKVEDLS